MKKVSAKKLQDLKQRQGTPLTTPTDLRSKGVKDIAGALNGIASSPAPASAPLPDRSANSRAICAPSLATSPSLALP